jgi:hypothetical protein
MAGPESVGVEAIVAVTRVDCSLTLVDGETVEKTLGCSTASVDAEVVVVTVGASTTLVGREMTDEYWIPVET